LLLNLAICALYVSGLDMQVLRGLTSDRVAVVYRAFFLNEKYSW